MTAREGAAASTHLREVQLETTTRSANGANFTFGASTMCMANVDGNKTLVCTVGDLVPGNQYRTPEGDTILVLDKAHVATPVGFTPTANLRTGVYNETPHGVKLGRDRKGRLYASRYLNPPKTDKAILQGFIDEFEAANKPEDQ